jgi:hypothetical protein
LLSHFPKLPKIRNEKRQALSGGVILRPARAPSLSQEDDQIFQLDFSTGFSDRII